MPKTAYRSSCRDKRTDGGFSPAAGYAALCHVCMYCQARKLNSEDAMDRS